jgi:hypothetical protein
VVWNVLVAHYRQLAEELIRKMSAGSSIFDSPAIGAADAASIDASQKLFLNAWRHMQQMGWLHLDSLWCWLLLGIGILIFLLACFKSWNDLDRYWDYRRFDLKRKNAEDDFENECIEVMNLTLANLDDCLQDCRRSLKDLERRSFKSEAIADLAEQRAAEVANTVAQWAHESKRLLKFYRDENRKVRDASMAVPPYWSSYPTVEEYRNLLVIRADGGEGNVELADRHLETIRHRREVQAFLRKANQEAFAELERFIHNLRVSVPTKVRELRKVARDQAQTSLAGRVNVASLLGSSAQAVAYFLQHAGCKLSVDGEEMTVRQAPAPLNVYAPFPVCIALSRAPDRKAIEALAIKAKAQQAEKESLACLVYEEAPDTIARTEFAIVRAQHKVSILPLDLKVVRRSLADGHNGCWTVLDGVWKNYGPGTDLFSLKNAVTDSMLFFGREPLLNELRKHLTQGYPVGLFGLRKSGKTSALNNLAATLQGHVVAKVDLLQETAEKFGARIFKDVIDQIVRQCKRGVHESKIKSTMSAAEAGPLFTEEILDLTKCVTESGRQLPIIVVLDEVERVLPVTDDTPAKANEFNAFFGVLRALSQSRGVLALLVADLHPDCNSRNYWPQPGVGTNPLHNALVEFYVPPFNEEETHDMLNGIGGLMNREFHASLSRAIHRKSGGHPVLSRQLASLIVARRSNQKAFVLDDGNRSLLENAFDASSFFQKYCSEAFLSDMQIKGPPAAERILRHLACTDRSVTLDRLIEKFDGEISEKEIRAAVLTLRDYGLVVIRQERTSEPLAILPELFSQLIRMTLSRREREQWAL